MVRRLALSTWAAHSLPTLTWLRIPSKNDATGLLTLAWNLGFWRKIAESIVDPERGKPEIK
jgi:hypothetical protein